MSYTSQLPDLTEGIKWYLIFLFSTTLHEAAHAWCALKPGDVTAYRGTDKMATYGLAALMAGGVAAKAGLFKGLFVALLAAKKLVIIGLVAVGGFFKKLFSKKQR